MKKKLVVHIPAYNEEERISSVISRIPEEILGYQVEILVVDDGSHDDTVRVAEQAGAHKIISHTTNSGVGEAFQTAVAYFFEAGADLLVNIDADGQFPPEKIDDLVRPLVEDVYDISIASRFSGQDSVGMPRVKYYLNKLIARMIGGMMGTKIEDLTCGFRAYTRESLLRLHIVASYTYTQEVIIDAIGKGMRLGWIPVTVTYFSERKSRVVTSIVRYAIKSIMIILRTVRDARPLVFFGVPGLVLTTIGVIALLVFVIAYLITFQTTPWRTWLWSGGIMLSAGLLLFVFASIADMIKKHRKVSEDNMYMLRKLYYTDRS